MYWYNKKRAETFYHGNPLPPQSMTQEQHLDWFMYLHDGEQGCTECSKPQGLMAYENYYFMDFSKKNTHLCFSCHRRLYPLSESNSEDPNVFNCPELKPLFLKI